ncbi:Sec-independent protein translocase protein TatB [Tsukamurella sp. 8F]|uniref:Sec-independent protein translocase protein TatB n=1 Tax=unclassified Tsukamurella TaxID=2633480 RepID=UPI0023B8FEB9|nr:MULTISPECIES: Sec-independent protein translocase protein TatB [unclassified Tsukamurella]MDF0529035.1 Sec-independent protein translocase protein TatB [Tsukamurella sp. 8J]MDF0587408.1 Sec-independent protein translocase protein TatB [Tsukamurella sp. 8F]
MFNIGWSEFLVLAVAGLVILGPERLPEAVQWTMNALRQVREYATGATQQLKDEMGTDFEEFREPLQQIQKLRGMTPAGIVTKHLFDGDDSFLRGDLFDASPTKPASTPGAPAAEAAIEAPANGEAAESSGPVPTMPRMSQPLKPGERPPFDPDAT